MGGLSSCFQLQQPTASLQYISASWEVQKVGSHIYGTTVSSQWAGIGGHFTGDALIQAGTASYATGGYGHRYFAWYEMLPTSSQSGNSSAVQVFSVSPGDVIDVEISEWGQSSSTWQITIGDVTNGMLYQNIFTYTPDMKYAEWIEERTQLNKDHLANFGTAHFGPYFTGISNNPNEVEDSANSVFYNIGQLPNYNITMYNDTSNRNLAVPGPLFGTIYQSDSFNVTWKNPY